MSQYYTFSSGNSSCQSCQPASSCQCGQTCPMPPMPPKPPAPPPRPQPQPDPDCCRQQGLSAALQMLQSGVFATRINFNAFAFLTENFVNGTYLSIPVTTGGDTLGPLTGSFVGLPCQMPGLADITGTTVYPIPLTAAEVSGGRVAEITVATGSMLAELNQIDAVAFQALNATAEEYAALRQLLLQQLCQMTPYIPGPGCREPRTGAAALLTSGFPGRTVSLTVGHLVLNNVEMLGFIGDILVLGSPTTFRFYLVRADEVTFLQ